MTSFKEQLESDIADVFMNLDELAEMHNINGTNCRCIIEGLNIDQQLQATAHQFESIGGQTVVVHVGKSELGYVPGRNETIWIDDEASIFLVRSVCDDLGMLTITLGRDN